MQNQKLLLGLGITLWMVACSRTPLPTAADAAADEQPTPDASAGQDRVPGPDSATLAPDAAPPEVPVRDGAAPDLADAAGTDLLARDATIADLTTVEAPADVRDSAVPDAAGFTDTREVAADPFAGRTFRIDDMNPAPTPDPACTPKGPAAAATLTFSADLATLTGVASSGSAAFRFSATAGPEANRITYHVTNLTGGQVFFERDQDVEVAQVVLYGSGVPVVWCLRGALLPQP